VLSHMNNGYDNPVSDMIVMGPRGAPAPATVPQSVEISAGYGAEIIRDHPLLRADYEPFSPEAVYEAVNYSQGVTTAGTWHVAIVIPSDEMQYSLAIGYREEFIPTEWMLVPVNVIETHLQEGQFIREVLAPFLAVVMIGFILIKWRLQRQSKTRLHVRVCIHCRAAVPWRGCDDRCPDAPCGQYHRLFSRVLLTLLIIEIARLSFWAGLVIGPLLAIIAVVVPDR
jgi:hypothetical protein